MCNLKTMRQIRYCIIAMFLLCSHIMTRFHHLFFALRPPAPVAAAVDRIRRAQRLPGPWVPRERLAVSLLSLGKHAVMPLRLIDQVSELIGEETLSACRVEFDQLVNGRKTASLRASQPLQDIERLQAQLGGCLTKANIAFEHRWLGAQLTLGYNVSAASRHKIDPLGWRAGELVLIDSIYGEGKHLTMARWRLGHGDPGEISVPAMTPVPLAPEEQLSLFA